MHPNEVRWRALFEALFVTKDDAKVWEICAPDMMVHVPGSNFLSGDMPLLPYRDAVSEFATGSLEIDIEVIFANENRIVPFYRLSMERDGSKREFEAHNSYRVVDNKLVEAWVHPADLDKYNHFYS